MKSASLAIMALALGSGAMNFGPTPAYATPQTGIRPEVAKDNNPRKKGRGARRREAAAKRRAGK